MKCLVSREVPVPICYLLSKKGGRGSKTRGRAASNLLGLKITGAIWNFVRQEGLAKLVPFQDLVSCPVL